MNISRGTLRHHLKFLEKQKLITKICENRYRRYFIDDKFGKKEKEIIDILQKDVPRNILLYIMSYTACSQIELSKSLEKQPSTIAFHLKKLTHLGLIKYASEMEGKFYINDPAILKPNKANHEKIYMLADRLLHYKIYDLLIICKNNLSDKKFLNDLLLSDVWKECYVKKRTLYPRRRKIKIFIPSEDHIETLIELFYEVFPYPYHV